MQTRSKVIVKVFFIITWLVLFGYFIFDVMIYPYMIIPFRQLAFVNRISVSQRVVSPDDSRIALLEQADFFDTNFLLYILDWDHCSDIPTDVADAIWVSPDCLPGIDCLSQQNVEWSKDSSVIAVIMGEEYTYAYDFGTGEEWKNAEYIRDLLESRSSIE
ncbi:MAG: hypothetical protein GY832_08565 [Chloroflexi bacterium]|nr:hypothetical protein [Chloroflexota bacterium]